MYLSALLRAKDVRVNGVRVGKDVPLRRGDVVSYYTTKKQEERKLFDVNWVGGIGYPSLAHYTSMTEASHGFLVGASLPLFSSRNKTKIAEARHTAAQSELENARLQAETQLQSRYNELLQIRSAVQTYDVPLMHSTLDALKSAVLAGQMSIIDYYVEADNVYGNLSTYLSLENQYRKLLAEAYRNRL